MKNPEPMQPFLLNETIDKLRPCKPVMNRPIITYAVYLSCTHDYNKKNFFANSSKCQFRLQY